MNRGVYTSATGMMTLQQWMDVNANNLANASTTGFKRDGIAFGEMFEQRLAANGGYGAMLGSIGVGPVPRQEFTNFELGAIQTTGNSLDLALTSERGAFQVQSGSAKYFTRDGSFVLNEQRQLTTKRNELVLDKDGAPIELPPGAPSVAADGTVSVDGKAVAQIGVFDGGFVKRGQNDFTLQGASQPLAAEEYSIRSGALEQSNVNAVQAMINLITIGRSYELAQKSITQQDELSQRLIQSLQER